MALRCSCPLITTFAVNLRNLACVGSVACAMIASAQVNVTAAKQSASAAKARMYYVEVKKTLNAEKLKPGDPVEFSLIEATLLSGHVVAPTRATMHGKVLQVQPANRSLGQQSLLSVLVDSITWKTNTVPVCASIAGFGTREFKFTGDPWPMKPAMNNAMQQQQSLADSADRARSFVQMQSDAGFGVRAGGGDLFGTPDTNVVTAGESWVKDLLISRSPNSASVLMQKDKSIKLGGGTLVALEELSNGGEACPAATSQ